MRIDESKLPEREKLSDLRRGRPKSSSPDLGHQHACFERNSVFSPAHCAEVSPACLAEWHWRWLLYRPVRPDSSTFLRSLRSIPITGLHGYYRRSDSCKAGSSAPALGQHERRFSPPQVSLIHVSDLPIPPSPTTPQALDADFARYPSSRRVSRLRRSRLHHFPAGSPTLTGRIEFVILRMDRSPPVASHPVSRRRSYSWLQAGERIPEEDFHLSDNSRFQTHKPGDSSPHKNCRMHTNSDA